MRQTIFTRSKKTKQNHFFPFVFIYETDKLVYKKWYGFHLITAQQKIYIPIK